MALKAGYYGIKKKLLEQFKSYSNIIFPRSEQNILGAKNLLSYNVQTQTKNGVTYTVNSDGTIKINGTATSNGGIDLVDTRNQSLQLFKGKITFSKGTDSSDYQFYFNEYNGSTLVRQVTKLAGISEFTFDNNYSDYDGILIGVYVANGKTVNNEICYPMIRLASDPDDTYVPYAMTNRELTLASSSGGLDYSTTEQDTGLTWVDGKKIYQKTFHKTNVSSGNTVLDDTLKIDSLISAEGMGVTSNGLYSLPMYKTSSTYFNVVVAPSTSFLPYAPMAELTYSTIPEFYVTLKYTKKE